MRSAQVSYFTLGSEPVYLKAVSSSEKVYPWAQSHSAKEARSSELLGLLDQSLSRRSIKVSHFTLGTESVCKGGQIKWAISSWAESQSPSRRSIKVSHFTLGTELVCQSHRLRWAISRYCRFRATLCYCTVSSCEPLSDSVKLNFSELETWTKSLHWSGVGSAVLQKAHCDEVQYSCLS